MAGGEFSGPNAQLLSCMSIHTEKEHEVLLFEGTGGASQRH